MYCSTFVNKKILKYFDKINNMILLGHLYLINYFRLVTVISLF